MPFPSTISTFNQVSASDRLNNPSHSALHNSVSSVLVQVQTVIGTDASTLGTLIGDLRSASSDGGGHIQSANKGGTGQTTYTKGDILVATSSSVLAKLAVGGTAGQALVVDPATASGVKWGTAGTAPNIRVYSTASTLTWNKPSNLAYIEVELVGGGASGAGVGGVGTGGGGGGGGAYARGFIPASMLGATETIVVGSASVLSSFGALVIAGAGTAAANETGGAGGDVSGTWVSSVLAINNFDGQTSKVETATTPDLVSAGMGGGNVYGQGGQGVVGTTTGASGSIVGFNATGYGAGGGGGIGANPGIGTQGLVIVREY